VLTEEGLELESRVLAFAREAGEVGRAFDAEAEALDDIALDRAAVRCGLGVLHALVERMSDALGDLSDPSCGDRAAA
jgi:hypothetical protein